MRRFEFFSLFLRTAIIFVYALLNSILNNVLLPDIIGHGKSIDTKKGDSIDKMSLWVHDISLACFGGYDINHFDAKMQKGNTSAQMLMMLSAHEKC